MDGAISSQNDLDALKLMKFSAPPNNIQNIDLEEAPIVIDVGGKTFKVTKAAILDPRRWNTTLTKAVTANTNYNPSTNQYYFDRNSKVFSCIVDYYRTGELHVPHGICGEFVRKELSFWGIPKKAVSLCCVHKLGRYQRKLQEKEEIEREFSRRSVDDVWPVDGMVTQGGGCLSIERKRKMWLFLNNPRSSRGAMAFSVVVFACIVVSIAAMILNTVQTIRRPYSTNETIMSTLYNTAAAMNITNVKIQSRITTSGPAVIFGLNYFFMAFFTVEFIVRLIAERNKCAYLRSKYAILDMMALLPSYADFLIKGLFFGMRLYENYTFVTLFWVIELFLILKILRLFRLAEYYDGLRVLLLSLKASWKELILLQTFLVIGMSFFGSLIYYVELLDEDAYFSDILIGCWWAVITMTTVGYGDTYPISIVGRILGTVAATFGIILMGLPIAIIANNFSRYYEFVTEKRESKRAKAEEEGPKRSKEIIKVKEIHLNTAEQNCFKQSKVDPQNY